MKKPEESAFPFHYDAGGEQGLSIGLNKREYFASITLQGLLAHGWNNNVENQNVAHKAICIADEILKQLER